MKHLSLLLFTISCVTAAKPQGDQTERLPNILWIVTDDQRADSIAAFNRIRNDVDASPLGKVLSPDVDRLAQMGTTFINTFNQNPGCAPSRTLMHTGRYSHRTGVYGFEYYNPIGQKHWRPMVPEILRDKAGYQTMAVGKIGIRAQHFKGQKYGTEPPLYQTFLGYRKEFAAKGLVDWNKETRWAKGKPLPKVETFYFTDGTRLNWPEKDGANPDDRAEINKRLDLLRQYKPGETNSDASILAGVNPTTGDRTRDGSFVNAFIDHLAHAGEEYTDMLDRKQTGPVDDKPMFAYVGFDFPHTPVLPPAEFREKFQQLKYEIPNFTKEELASFPPQLLRLYKNSQSDHFTDEEKHQMIADYYAFCAYGDELVGRAVDKFIDYSKKQQRPWLILYVCGDHGWRLNEHGMVSKFSHYDTDLHNPLIVVSSDKKKFPAGKVVKDFTQFVDMAPTFLAAGGIDVQSKEYDYLDGRDLARVVNGKERPRDYIIAEPTWVIGPRAVIRTKDYKFAMKVRARAGHYMSPAMAGKDIKWAINADLKDIEPTLYDRRKDPGEVNNLAFDGRYRPVLKALRSKLQNIVLGNGRVEVVWTKTGNDKSHLSSFALGSDDGRLKVPVPLAKTAAKKAAPKKTNRPNIVFVFADDISARELPIYGSSKWSPPLAGDTSDPKYRAQTPALDRLAKEGCWITTTWAATVCSPSRAMMMTGRYAHRHKWWTNKDIGEVQRPNGKREKWPLYESSPIQLGHLLQKAGYATFWTGKTQMPGDLRKYGFDEGCFTPGNLSDRDNPYADFKHEIVKRDGTKVLINKDTGKVADTYQQHGWYWYPHVRLMKHPSAKKDFEWWPNTPKAQKDFGVATYGPDVELDFAFEFMERQHQAGKPFFVYHCSHLGHDAFNWLNPSDPSKWPGTPKVKWDGKKYTRTEPKITGDKGIYDTHGTITESGIHTHVNYLDYQMWLYRKKLKQMGIADNTIVIFCADNGTSKYGKHSSDRQKGTHVPLIIYAPGMMKHGKQDILVNLSDFLPTFADFAGTKIPANYPIDGVSLHPFLMTKAKKHRDWIYAYKGPQQFIRGRQVMLDGTGKWWDVAKLPDDLISFPQIDSWPSMTQAHRNERNKFKRIIPQFDNYDEEHDAPGTPSKPKRQKKK